MRVPLYLEPEDTGLTRASGAVRRLLLMFGASFIKIWQAVLLEKRVIFSAHKQAASEACEAVLALCALFRPLHGCGIIARAFPHATLSTMDQWLAVPGFIVGVANPVFKDRDQWWDIMADLNTGEVVEASHVIDGRKRARLKERAATQVADADEASAARMRLAETASATTEADAIDKTFMTRASLPFVYVVTFVHFMYRYIVCASC